MGENKLTKIKEQGKGDCTEIYRELAYHLAYFSP